MFAEHFIGKVTNAKKLIKCTCTTQLYVFLHCAKHINYTIYMIIDQSTNTRKEHESETCEGGVLLKNFQMGHHNLQS